MSATHFSANRFGPIQ